MWKQKIICLQPKCRGFHLITEEVMLQLPELTEFKLGLAHLFIRHTSASLTLNENADPDVQLDMEDHFNHFVPENQSYYRHTSEGADDMPAHIKASLLGSSLMLPIRHGSFDLGVWQGIYLGEHRDQAAGRQIIVTLQGEAKTY
ncbi:MAG: secondary thiamine-phosphate synthase enzyme YjbQ [Mariprofundaceae bacterium]